MAPYRVGIDIGGTFTDIVVVAGDGRDVTKKVSSTVDNYARAIVEGLDEVFTRAGMDVGRIVEFMHGTTVASNTILEAKGARIGLIATEGFRDILEIGNLRMPRLYDMGWDKPPPLVERYLRLTVPERIGAGGAVEKKLSRRDAEAALRRLIGEGVEGIAVCLLNSYVNDSHERLIGEVAAELAPGLPVCLSCDVLPQIKEYERTSTTVINAYIMPLVGSYLSSLAASLEAGRMMAPVLIMQSNGALTPLDEACRHPVTIVESGPAAGVVGAVARASESGHHDIISFDMGGTTAKASLAEGSKFTLSQQYSVGGGIMVSSRLLTGGGYLLGIPAIDIAEVGAGGGSIVWIDAGGSLQVGPESAGSSPGPLCYDTGGDRPTVTDANLILGYLNPEYLVDGELALNAGRAHRIFKQLVADRLGLDPTLAAYGSRQVAITNMIRAIRAVSSERGRDPRRFTLFAMGGNGALFAAGIAEELGITTVLVPPSAGVFSAWGLLYADVGHYFTRTVGALLGDLTDDHLMERWRDLDAEAMRQLANDGFAEADMELRRFANLRYRGQVFEITVPVDDDLLDSPPLAMAEVFGAEHERTYGHRAGADEPVQLLNIQVFARGMRREREAVMRPTSPRTRLQKAGARAAYFGPSHGWLETPVISRHDLTGPRSGPLIIEEYDTTCLVPPHATVDADAIGNIRIELSNAANTIARRP